MKQHLDDWLFSDDHRICHFRTAGVLIKNGKLFVQRDKDNIYALPGGHVSFGETSKNALIREFWEEAGLDISIIRLIWIEENFWNWGSKNAHNITFYYLVSLKTDSGIDDTYEKPIKDNAALSLQWADISKLKDITIYPAFVSDKVRSISDTIEHFVSNSWQ